MKNLILCDLDGTLLRNDGTMSNDTITYINELTKRNFFIIVTSSSYQKVLPIYKKLGLDSHIVCKNGGLIINPITNDKFVYSITKEEILFFFNDLKNKITSMFYKCEGDAYFYNHNKRYEFIMNVPNNVKLNNDDYNNLKLVDSTNLYVVCPSSNSDDIENYFLLKNLKVDCLGKDSKNAIYLITHKKALKEESIEFLKNKYSFNKLIAFGDSEFDIKMLEKSDIPFLMRNSNVKNSSLPISEKTNDEDGVIVELKKMNL